MKGRKVLVVLGVLLLLGAGAGFGYVRGGMGHHAALAHPKPPAPVSASLAEITTNLADGHYIQLQCNVDLAGGVAARRFAKRHAAVVNAVLGVLRGETSQALIGGNGMKSLATSLTAAIDGVIGGKLVEHVYFTQFVVQ